MSELDLGKAVVDEKKLNELETLFRTSIEQNRCDLNIKIELLSAKLEDAKLAQVAVKAMKVTKYYPIDADEEILIEKSAFVNRYLGNAAEVKQ